MIFIQGQNGDSSTHEVLRYFMHWKIPFVKLADTDFLDELRITISDTDSKIILSNKNISIDLSAISAYWYRRGNLGLNKDNINIFHPNIPENEIFRFITTEYSTVTQFVNYHLEKSKRQIGAFSKNNLNKIIQLQLAKEVGFKIPRIVICNNKIEVQQLYDEIGPLGWFRRDRCTRAQTCESCDCSTRPDSSIVFHTNLFLCDDCTH